MSYILDALRRAEAERERGAVPGLASQQHSIEIEEEEAPERSRLMLWAVIGLAFALVATLAWTFLGGRATPSRQIADGTVTPMPATPAAPAAPAVPQSLAEIAAVPSASVAPVPTPAADAVARTIVTPAAPPPRTQVATTTPAPRPVVAPIAKTSPALAQAMTQAAASEPRIYAQSELPEDVRRDLPRIAVNGSSYSGDAASRMVMVNGQVFHEGDQLAAGLVLDKIRRRSAVLVWKGYRYELMF